VPSITDPEDGVLFRQDYTLDDGSEARVLDLLRVDLREHQPKPHQPENWRISGLRWHLVERPASASVASLLRSHLAPGPAILGSGSGRVAYDELFRSPARASLALVLPRDLVWHAPGNPRRSRPQVRARFRLGGVVYDLAVTDPVFLEMLGDLPQGSSIPAASHLKPDESLLLTISLGEPFEGFCYKLVAAVVVVPAAWGIGATGAAIHQRAWRRAVADVVPDAAAQPGIRDVHLARFATSLGSPLSMRLASAFSEVWERTRSEDEAAARLGQMMEVVLRERLRETARH